MPKLLAPRALPPALGVRHPAYLPIMHAYAETGSSVTRALRSVAEFWDDELQGSLPTRQTVHRWVTEDEWDDYIEAQVGLVRRAVREKVNNAFFAAAPQLAKRLIDIAHGEFTDPKAAMVQVNAAWKVMTALGVGVLENKTGDVPEGDEAESKKLRTRIRSLPLADVQELQQQRVKLLEGMTDGE